MGFKAKAGTALITIGAMAIFAIPSVAKETPVRDIESIEVDKAQLRQAVASRTLTWLTGSSSNNDYVSVGRLANFFGFVALRVGSGHSLSRSAVAKETLHSLTPKQQSVLIALVDRQKAAFEDVQSARYDMNRALEGLLVGEEISRAEFLELGAAYGAAEAELGRFIGQGLGHVAVTLSPKQNEKLADIRARYISGNARKEKIRGIKTKLSKDDKKELVNLAARLLSWTTGGPSFNDFEVVGKPSQHFGFVSLRIESNHGVKRGAVANEVRELLTIEQQASLDRSADYNIEVFERFIERRGHLMRTLEVALNGDVIDAQKVAELGAEMGILEADMTWAQAMAMLDVRQSMSEAQMVSLLNMRKKYTGDLGVSSSPHSSTSVDRGRQLFAQCALCHTEAKNNPIAPSLANILNRKIAADPDFENYSAAIKDYANANGEWSASLMDVFLKSPREAMPGTYMGYDGLKKTEDRAALISFLRSREIKETQVD